MAGDSAEEPDGVYGVRGDARLVAELHAHTTGGQGEYSAL
jgi:hypothetical protein